MCNVLALVVREITADGAFSGFSRIGGSDKGTKIGHGILFFQHHGYARSTRHESDQFAKKWAFMVNSIEAFGFGARELYLAEGPDVETSLLDSGEDFTGQVLADTVWLENGESTFHGYKRLDSRTQTNERS